MAAIYVDALAGAIGSGGELNDIDSESTLISAALAGTEDNPGVPTLGDGDFVRMSFQVRDATTGAILSREDVALITYTEGDPSGTIARAQNGTTEQSWPEGAKWIHGWTSEDIAALPTPGVESVVAGTGITVDDTDPANPVVSAPGVLAVVAGTGITVDDTEPEHPVVSNTGVLAVAENTDTPQQGFVSVFAPRLPVTPFSGVIQPTPPLVGFAFPSTPYRYDVGATPEALYYLCAGSDHNIWIADTTGGVWQVDPITGAATHFDLGGLTVQYICSGSDGNIWVCGGTHVAQVSVADGALLATLSPSGAGSLVGICAGPDGNLWVPDQGGGIYRIATDGTTDRFLNGAGGTDDAHWACSGPDGNIWVTGRFNGKVFVISTDGALVATFVLEGDTATSRGICTGPDRNLWITDTESGPNGFIWRLTPAGVATRFGPIVGGQLDGLCVGAGGDLWAVDGGSASALYKITVLGEITAFPHDGGAQGICSGPDGGLWMPDYGGGGVVTFPFQGQVGQLRLTGGPLSTRLLTIVGSPFAYQMSGAEATIVTDFIVDLPPPADNLGATFVVKDSGNGTAALAPNAGENIDGVNAPVVLTAYQAVRATSDGANWWLV